MVGRDRGWGVGAELGAVGSGGGGWRPRPIGSRAGFDGASWEVREPFGSAQISRGRKSFPDGPWEQQQQQQQLGAQLVRACVCERASVRERGCTILGSVLRLYGPDPLPPPPPRQEPFRPDSPRLYGLRTQLDVISCSSGSVTSQLGLNFSFWYRGFTARVKKTTERWRRIRRRRGKTLD